MQSGDRVTLGPEPGTLTSLNEPERLASIRLDSGLQVCADLDAVQPLPAEIPVAAETAAPEVLSEPAVIDPEAPAKLL